MNDPISPWFGFLTVVTNLLAVTGVVKLAAWLRHSSSIRWAHCLAFAAMLLAIGMSGRLIPFQPAGKGVWVLQLVLGVAIPIGVGMLFFKGRGVSSGGQVFDRLDAFKVMAIYVLLSTGLSTILSSVGFALLRPPG